MPLDFQFLGDCHHVALALHRLTKLPLCALYGVRGQDEHRTVELVLIHAGVIYQDCFVDELGIQLSPKHLLREFKNLNEPYVETHVFFFDTEDDPEFLSLLKHTGAKVDSHRVDFFIEWIQSNPEKFNFLSQFSQPH